MPSEQTNSYVPSSLAATFEYLCPSTYLHKVDKQIAQ